MDEKKITRVNDPNTTTLQRIIAEYQELKANGYKGDLLTVALLRIEALEGEHDQMIMDIVDTGSKKLAARLRDRSRLFFYGK